MNGAMVQTLGRMTVERGRVEVRAQTPYGQGLWPAIWLRPVDVTQEYPEIDALETWQTDAQVPPFDAHSLWMNYHWLDGVHKQAQTTYVAPTTSRPGCTTTPSSGSPGGSPGTSTASGGAGSTVPRWPRRRCSSSSASRSASGGSPVTGPAEPEDPVPGRLRDRPGPRLGGSAGRVSSARRPSYPGAVTSTRASRPTRLRAALVAAAVPLVPALVPATAHAERRVVERPAAGPPGSVVMLAGTGFRARHAVVVTTGGRPPVRVRADRRGRFTAAVRLRGRVGGRVDVRASDGRGRTISRFRVRATVPATQTAEAVSQHGVRVRWTPSVGERPRPRPAAGRRPAAPGARPPHVGGPYGPHPHRPPRRRSTGPCASRPPRHGAGAGPCACAPAGSASRSGSSRRPRPRRSTRRASTCRPWRCPPSTAAATPSSRPPATSPAPRAIRASTAASGPRGTAASSGPTGSSRRWRPRPSWASATSSTRTGRWRPTTAPTTARGGA